ncbi:MAG: FG-GAP repeat protein [Candidatus Electrothrix gigas]
MFKKLKLLYICSALVALSFLPVPDTCPAQTDIPPNLLDRVQKLIPGDGHADDWFGMSVAVDRNIAVIGAAHSPLYGNNSTTGRAYVFVRSGNNWKQRGKELSSYLPQGALEPGDNFGASVAVSGNTVIVGAWGDDGDDNNHPDAGAAYVFVRYTSPDNSSFPPPPIPSWKLQRKLTAPDGAVGDYFGTSVALSGNTAVIGTPFDDDKGGGSGSADVFVRLDGQKWTKQAKLTAYDAEGTEFFGWSVSVSGDTALIGAWGDDDNGESSGSAYVCTRSGDVWTEQIKLTASDAAAYDFFGYSVSVSGSTAVVGAPYRDRNGINNSGAAYVFENENGAWPQKKELPARTSRVAEEYFGYSVSADGDIILIGAPAPYSGDNGTAYWYTEPDWTLSGKLTAFDSEVYDAFGWSVSVDGGKSPVFFVGVPWDDDIGNASGSAYAFFTTKYGWLPVIYWWLLLRH